MPLSRDPEVVRDEILARVPIGTPIEDAKKTLLANEFAPNEWAEYWGKDGKSTAEDDIHYRRTLPQRDWCDFYPGVMQIYLAHSAGQVTGVRVEHLPGL